MVGQLPCGHISIGQEPLEQRGRYGLRAEWDEYWWKVEEFSEKKCWNDHVSYIENKDLWPFKVKRRVLNDFGKFPKFQETPRCHVTELLVDPL